MRTSRPTERRFWFEIQSTNEIKCVWAVSFTEAKQKAAKMYLPQWGLINWLDINGITP
jgi:hypothetical protein